MLGNTWGHYTEWSGSRLDQKCQSVRPICQTTSVAAIFAPKQQNVYRKWKCQEKIFLEREIVTKMQKVKVPHLSDNVRCCHICTETTKCYRQWKCKDKIFLKKEKITNPLKKYNKLKCLCAPFVREVWSGVQKYERVSTMGSSSSPSSSLFVRQRPLLPYLHWNNKMFTESESGNTRFSYRKWKCQDKIFL